MLRKFILTLRNNQLNIALSIVTILVCVLLGEITCRVMDYREYKASLFEALRNPPPMPQNQPVSLGYLIRPSLNEQIIYELKPNLSVLFVERINTTNSQGFRNNQKEYDVQKGKNTVRIIGIGDSLMYGIGTPDNSQYLSFLEAKLNQRYPQKRWEVINTGVPGYNTAQEVEVLKAKGIKYKPDIVVLGFCENDLSLPNFIRFKEDYFSLKKSFLKDFIEQRLKIAEKKVRSALDAAPPSSVFTLETTNSMYESEPSRVPVHYKDMVGWNGFTKAMIKLRDLSKEYGFSVVVLFLDDSKSEISDRAAQISAGLGFHVIDTLPYLAEYMRTHGIRNWSGSIMAVTAYDNHPSALVHEMTSEYIFEYMQRNGIVDKYTK